MEQLVNQYASGLMLEEPNAFYEAVRGLEELRAQGSQSILDKMKYSRLLQELSAYNGGAILKVILKEAFAFSASRESPCQELRLGLEACLMLVTLTDSPMVARACLQEVEDFRLLATALMGAHIAFMKSSEDTDRLAEASSCTNLHYALTALRGIVNFARASRAFCLTLQDYDDLFPALEHLLDTFTKSESVSFTLIGKAADDTLRLLSTFALSENCKEWAIDRGLIRLHAALIKLTLKGDLIEQRFKERSKETTRQNAKQPAETRRSYADLAQELLEIDRRMRDPNTEQKVGKKLRADFLRNVKHQAMRMCDGSENRSTKFAAARATGRFDTPIVCSLDLCDAGTALDAGRPFSKCANCSLAIYCR